jgi:hypothetical protein
MQGDRGMNKLAKAGEHHGSSFGQLPGADAREKDAAAANRQQMMQMQLQQRQDNERKNREAKLQQEI